ncbi:hypothetical protein NEF87_000250 [Candidatus Lokiarchaeum ossiferum]|uniref:Uncharacterized protein n=1 Tax=Candidatus Lokiarchaeum ossiferum TaxID=2951803 RepID=A0ABY6HKC0_9ARCH|nr:hypothetical protein NEF87_000250 [Candidatus Lokiarchaeum sp. B-35]
MRNKYIRNEQGQLVKVEKSGPKVEHDKSKEDYDQLIQTERNIMTGVNSILIKHLGQLQSRILNINILNIHKVFDYYFDQNTHRIDAHLDRLFIQSFKQIKDKVRNCRSISDDIGDGNDIKNSLVKIKNSFFTQRTYIQKIYEETSELKRKDQKFLTNF